MLFLIGKLNISSSFNDCGKFMNIDATTGRTSNFNSVASS